MTNLDDLKRVRSDDERTMLLGLAYGSSIEQELEQDRDFGEEREQLDDQILAGLVLPW